MMLRLVAALCALCLASAAFAWTLQQPPQVVGQNVEAARWQAARAGDQVGLNAYIDPARAAHAAVLYLPGTHMNGRLAVPDARHNIWLYLAERGVAVYALDYRSHFVASDATDIQQMRDWTTDVYVDDALHALAYLRDRHPDLPVFVMGFSRGAGLAYGVVCRAERSAVAGLIALDGGIKRADRGPPVDFAAALDSFAGQGLWAEDVAGRRGWAARQQMMQDAIDDVPNARDTLQGVLFNAWGPGRLANPGTLSRTEVLAALMIGYDRYYPAVQTAEGRLIATTDNAPHTTLDDCWGRMQVPVLAVIAERFSSVDGTARHSAVASGSADVAVISLDDFGHLDVLVAESARERVFEPVFAWIVERLHEGSATFQNPPRTHYVYAEPRPFAIVRGATRRRNPDANGAG
jgi:hypothetical protein